MIIVAFMKAVREVVVESLELRRKLAKRYPYALND